ncbi:MAG: hypothetical protein IJP98_02720 [Clostridia bacterium]|nr:hypothetical protein [Clostridia bacterium]
MRLKVIRLVVCLLIVLTAPLTLLGFASGLPAQYDRTYLAALNDKLDRLQTVDGKRIVLIGGSGAAFDVRSDLLETEFSDYSVINFGLYAGLGTSVMLDLAEPYLHAGDIVVFLPEQSAQTLSTYFNAEALWQATDGASVPWSSLSSEQRSAMLGAFPAFAGSKARLCFFDGKPSGDAIYARRSFNGYGDMACAGRSQNTMPGGFDTNMPISFDPASVEDALIDRLNAFAKICAQKGATLYFSFCPMNAAAISDEELARADAFMDALAARLDCSLLGTPDDAIYDAGWFFDTNFHLNEAGQIVYTARLAALLKDAAGDASPVSIALPAMPQSGFAPIYDGDDSDVDCFLYEPFADGWAITGLSETGKAREALTIPAQYDGLPVRGFAAATFAGTGTLRTLTISRNVTSIPDDAFSGCTVLERIFLTNPTPRACSVGQHLLDGTAATLVVPASAYSAYATDYFWSPYAARIEPADAQSE